MAGLQPEIVIFNRLYQNRGYTGAVGSQGVCKDLVSDQRTAFSGQIILAQCPADSMGKGFLGVGDAVNPMSLTEFFRSVPLAVGHNTQGNA